MSSRSLLIFLHGSGGTGQSLSSVLETYQFMFENEVNSFQEFTKALDIFISTPTAPTKPYSPCCGMPMSVWFDRPADFPRCGMEGPEDITGIERSWRLISEIISSDTEHLYFIIGGFSMGGAMALQCLSRIKSDSAKFGTKEIIVLMMHGTDDPLISFEWGRATASSLLLNDANIQFKEYDGVEHEMADEMLIDLLHWCSDILYTKRKSIGIDLVAERNDKKVASLLEKCSIDSDSAEVSHGIESMQLERQASTDSQVSDIVRLPDHIPYCLFLTDIHSYKDMDVVSIESQLRTIDEGNSDYSAPIATFKIVFSCPPDAVDVLTARSVLACGSAFDILPYRKGGVYAIATTPYPHRTAREIAKRLLIRLKSDGESLNACPMS